MDPIEVITIEDSPPTSPVRIVKMNNQHHRTMFQRVPEPQEMQFPAAEEAIMWSRATSNFIKNTMNTAANQKDITLTPNPRKSTMYKKIIPQQNTPQVQRSNFDCLQMPNIQSQYHPQPYPYQENPYPFISTNYYPMSPYQSYTYTYRAPDGRFINNYTPMYAGNFWWRVKLEEIPEGGEVVTQYYLDSGSQTPVRNVQPESSSYSVKDNGVFTQQNYRQDSNDEYVALPEFVDVNAFMNRSCSDNVHVSSSSATRFMSQNHQTIEQQMTASTATNEKKKYKNLVPPFLKRNRLVINPIAMKAIDCSKNNSDTISEQVISSVSNRVNGDIQDDPDIVFVGEFKNGVTPAPTNSNETLVPKTESVTNSPAKSEKREENLKCPNNEIVKKKRKNPIAVPRRNPKRQVQIEKDYFKYLGGIVLESEKEQMKPKKTNKYKSNKNSSRPEIKPFRRSARVLASCGAIYCPPSPLTIEHYRDWPTEGMHERPEFDPVSGRIEPFDRYIREIAEKYKPSTESNQNENSVTESASARAIQSANQLVELNKNKTFPQLCHEMFHHVFAYVATVKNLEKEEKLKTDKAEEDYTRKMSFLNGLALAEAENDTNHKICDILKETVNAISTTDTVTDAKNFDLTDLIQNSLLLYCMTNNVEQSDVAKYIATLNPDEIIQLSNENFHLEEKTD